MNEVENNKGPQLILADILYRMRVALAADAEEKEMSMRMRWVDGWGIKLSNGRKEGKRKEYNNIYIYIYKAAGR